MYIGLNWYHENSESLLSKIKLIMLHPNYDGSWSFDQSLINIKGSFDFNDQFKPACLPRYLLDSTSFSTLNFFIAGYGLGTGDEDELVKRRRLYALKNVEYVKNYTQTGVIRMQNNNGGICSGGF